MSTEKPEFFSGTGTATVTPTQPRRQMLVGNKGPTDQIDVGWNRASGGWRLDPGQAKGQYVRGGVTQVVITPVAGSPAWQVELYD